MTPEHDILQVTPRVEALAALCRSNSRIDPALYRKYDVKRGLRDINGQGVLAGLTNISDIISRKEIGGEIVPCEGELYYRGIRIQDLVQGFIRDGRKGYEEVAYLLLFGELPDAKRLGDFKAMLAQGRTLPTNFTRDVIMKAPTHDMMNSLSRSVLTLASYDSNADDISLPNVLRQCLMLISVFPMLAVYSYHATITTSAAAACTFTTRRTVCLLRPTSCACCARICSTRRSRQECSIWRLCCTWSTAAAITRHSQHTSSRPPARIPIRLLQRRSVR